MNKSGSGDGTTGTRHALGDLTNNYGKRGLALAPGKFVIEKDISRSGNYLENKVVHSDSRKRVCRGPDKLFEREEKVSSFASSIVRECSTLKIDAVTDKDKDGQMLRQIHTRNFLDYNAEQQHVSANRSLQISKKGKELSNALNPGLHLIRGKAVVQSVTEAIPVGTSCISSVTVPGLCDKERSNAVTGEHLNVTDISKADATKILIWTLDEVEKNHIELCGDFSTSNSSKVGNLKSQEYTPTSKEKIIEDMSGKSGLDCSSQPSLSPASTCCHLEDAAKLHQSSSSFYGLNEEADLDLGKTCSCSFCLKAAYIWSDLLFQDAKDQALELKKSRREARILVRESYCTEAGDKCQKINSLESDLLHRWRSLLLHTENAFICEGAQIQANLIRYREWRVNYKRNLETVSQTVPLSKFQQTSYDSG